MLKLVKPTIDNLYLRTQLLADEDTMAFNHDYGGTLKFPKENYEKWLAKWVNGEKRHYYYVFNDDEFVGEAAYYIDDNERYQLSIIILYQHRHKGYGTQVLHLLIEDAKQHGVDVLYDEVAYDNPAIEIFLKNGFKIISRTEKTILISNE